MAHDDPFTTSTDPQARAAMVQALRERYLNGTLDEVLVPVEPEFGALMDDLRTPEDEIVLREVTTIHRKEKTA